MWIVVLAVFCFLPTFVFLSFQKSTGQCFLIIKILSDQIPWDCARQLAENLLYQLFVRTISIAILSRYYGGGNSASNLVGSVLSSRALLVFIFSWNWISSSDQKMIECYFSKISNAKANSVQDDLAKMYCSSLQSPDWVQTDALVLYWWNQK